ncbi:Rap1a/Tai family immunity protein [Roseibium alexandrii]|uniref:Rap1a immunity protein domain-containing protein n=1 Tax=Roseibium alexandrii (strain DSM 17067 / NCIMB 14079 / DFL-11) TaxID=244592 RepID=A0A5E8GX40_ROSAD|nr:Rap1a/Tai family immunity protein [Roseibium alexandrii]EEE43916.2 hypothetical protein SADFL11_1202 [Roseibium alexandrii DFL-11]
MFKSLMSAMVIAGALVLPGKAFAEDGAAVYSGAELFEVCLNPNEGQNRAICMSYVSAVVDSRNLIKTESGLRLCVPERTPIKQLIKSALIWMNDQPRIGGLSGAEAVFFALKDKYPC